MAVHRHRTLTPADLTLLAPADDCASLFIGVGHEDDLAWARAAQDRWGLCGVLAGTVEAPRGWVLVVPSPSVPARHPMASRSRTPDAAVLVAAHVTDDDPACFRQLVQTLAARLVGQASCLEAVAGRRGARGRCEEPQLDWLLAAGFTDVTDDDHRRLGQAPRMRLDLRRTVLSHAARVLRSVAGRAWVPVAPEPSRRGVGTTSRTG